MNYLNM